MTDQRRRSIQISIPVILEGVPEPTPADSEAANGGEPSLSDPHSPEARDEEDGSLPADASVLLSSTGLIATRASSVGGRPTLGAQGIAAITPGGGLGRARVRATQQRRGSTGAPIALKSPMFSPITLVTNAANAALHGAAPAFSLGECAPCCGCSGYALIGFERIACKTNDLRCHGVAAACCVHVSFCLMPLPQ